MSSIGLFRAGFKETGLTMYEKMCDVLDERHVCRTAGSLVSIMY